MIIATADCILSLIIPLFRYLPHPQFGLCEAADV
jgi:hypothetical protein